MWNVLKFMENDSKIEKSEITNEKSILVLQSKLEKELKIISIQQEIIEKQKKKLIERERKYTSSKKSVNSNMDFIQSGMGKKKVSEILDFMEDVIIHQKKKEYEIDEKRKELNSKLNEISKNKGLKEGKVGKRLKESNEIIKEEIRNERVLMESLKEKLLLKEDELIKREERLNLRENDKHFSGGYNKIGTFKNSNTQENNVNSADILRMKGKIKAKESELIIKEENLKNHEKYLKAKIEELNREREKLFQNETEKERNNKEQKGKIKTGILRLDDLLLGGFQKDSNVIITGPPFIGKDVLLNLFITQGLKSRTPCIYVTTNKKVSEIKKELEYIIPHFKEYEKRGLIYFVDAYSKTLGLKETGSNVEFAEPQKDLNEIESAINKIQNLFGEKHKQVRIVFNSISTLIAQSSAGETFNIIQTLCGKNKEFGAASLFVIDPEMHKKSEIEMFKHLMDGVIEFEENNMKTMLRVKGICDVHTRAWVEYKHSKKMFDLVGSFSLEHIR